MLDAELHTAYTRPLATLALCALTALAGCQRGAPEPSKTLHIYAASSLTEAFEAMAESFEATHPEVNVSLNFAGSQVLRLQLEHGARADIFASANPDHVQTLVHKGLIHESRLFARNALVVIVPPHNPAAITAFADLPRATRVIIGTEHVPVGRYTRTMLRRAAGQLGTVFETTVLGHVVSHESNVRLIRAKVELGEADAAIVYRTDAMASTRVRQVPIPSEINVRAAYLIGVTRDAPNPAAAARWLAFVTSSRGRAILTERGFEAP
jgi:molybdate transport system substrate-binding protein